MPSAISHAAVAAAAGIAFAPQGVPPRFWPLALICSVLPDADVMAFAFGIPYHHYFGHRGFFHSLFFALMLSLFVTSLFFREEMLFSGKWFFYAIFFFLLTASHGILDAFTNGGLGIALFSPLNNERYFFPWTPIAVSPIGIKAFLSKWGWVVVKSEFMWVWLPAFILAVVSTAIRKVIVRF
ncbi:MAG: metal-dependent hydrolase [Deltaproteobacteria bacterium]|nr:metal-dependent hydrolase [Deltaproteobacteria bacterium]